MRRSTVVAAAVVLALAWRAGAQEERGKGRPGGARGAGRLLGGMDKDKDGQISREEYKGTDAVFKRLDQDGDGSIGAEEAARATRYMSLIVWDLVDREELFKAIDGNGDGNVTAEEMKAAPLAEIMAKALAKVTGRAGGGAAQGGLMGRFDKNGDGKVSRDEFPPERLALFDRLDKNSDGFIDAEEMAKVQGGKDGQAGKGGLVGRFDKNGDGRISREEFPQEKIQAFDRFDKNGDGFIDADELKDGRKGKKPDQEVQ